jgi:hypothetical protein
MSKLYRYLPLVARLCLAMFLFGQFAVTAQACTSLQSSPATAFSHAEQLPCHPSDAGDNRNACLMHCIQGDQVLDSQQHGLAVQPVVVHAASSTVTHAEAWPSTSQRPVVVAINSSPPIPILYCRFLN